MSAVSGSAKVGSTGSAGGAGSAKVGSTESAGGAGSVGAATGSVFSSVDIVMKNNLQLLFVWKDFSIFDLGSDRTEKKFLGGFYRIRSEV